MSTADYLETEDGAKIYYEDRGEGHPILLVHGWLCSSKFWQKNVPELAKSFRVVAMDLRGHGNSSKILSGHTLRQYGRDVRRVIEHLGLENTTLVGWSLGGAVVLSYYHQYCTESRLSSLGLIDSCPFPFSAAEWNNHVLRDHNFDRLHLTFALYTADPRKFASDFRDRMLRQKLPAAETDWIIGEMMKTPPWIAEAIYSDFVMTDLAKMLPMVHIPMVVMAGNSGVFPNGIGMGKALAGRAAHGTFVPFEHAGHMLFYEQPEKFDAALGGFIKSLGA